MDGRLLIEESAEIGQLTGGLQRGREAKRCSCLPASKPGAGSRRPLRDVEHFEPQSAHNAHNQNRKAHRPRRYLMKAGCPVAARHASRLHDIVRGLHRLARSRQAFL